MKRNIRQLLYLNMLGMAFVLSLNAAPDFPDTPAGKRAKEVFDLLNGVHAQSPKDYAMENFAQAFKESIPAPGNGLQQIKNMFGNVELVEISESEQDKISYIIKPATHDLYLTIKLQVEPDEPHFISSLGLIPGTKPVAAGNQTDKKTVESKIKTLDDLHQYLTQKTDDNEFSGTVLVAKDGTAIFQHAYGYASKKFQTPNNLDTKFNIASCNKFFTTVAVLQLMDAGKLSMDDPIGKYLDMFPQEIADNVTIRHLLDMTSGWGDYWNNETYRLKHHGLRKVSDYIDFIKDIPLDFKPGTKKQHCNIGFEVAGAIIEKLTELDYYDYIRSHIYKPAGMIHTDSYPRDECIENMAMGYTNMNPFDHEKTGYQWTNIYFTAARGTPAGGGFSTVRDLLKFDRALRNNVLLSPEYTRYLFNRRRGTPGDPVIADGMIIAVGATIGANAYFGIDLAKGYTIVVLSNYDPPAAMDVGKIVQKIVGL